MGCHQPVFFVVLLCAVQLHALEPVSASKGVKCAKTCPKGQQCELRLRCNYGLCQGYRQVCVKWPAPAAKRPPSCQDVRCSNLETCALRQFSCARALCHPRPVCIHNRCTLAYCGDAGTTCVTTVIPGSSPTCSDFPSCRYSISCEPRAKPKPGFCPPPKQVSQANVNRCQYDNDCASNLLCCPGASGGGRGCTAPAFPDPCASFKCPPAPNIAAYTCAVRGGKPTCLDRVCQPGSFFCRDGKQLFCTDQANIVRTNLPAPSNCTG